ncbi:MAG: ATP-dependent helicase [Pseudonocardiales bacterium]|nr:ATP-dependent helicase [Jatrophihabitantaceae bacterium]MCW2603420.1 ATP-dependent helicase [Pseudonocardiales bacterium]
MSSADLRRELADEQAYISDLYTLLDHHRATADEALARATGTNGIGTPAALSERDAFVALHTARVLALRSVEDRLCFGRLDVLPDDSPILERRYIGRTGLTDDSTPAREQKLIDWRAPAALPFYQATAASPLGVLRRRHISTVGRKATGIEDEVLDLDAFSAAGEAAGGAVAGEGALFVALNATRTGRMRDIVSTIQADQDRVIRAPLEGVLVIQGGPGTGKTAVALHRTAFLLYTHRERIARAGVLLVGPNRVFLRYIEQVLPALGEAGAVVMATPGQLFPGVDATAWEPDDVARIKGDERMARVIARAVGRRQRVPERMVALKVDGTTLMLRPRDVIQARDNARRGGKAHNQGRVTFVKDILGRLARQLAEATGAELDQETRNSLMETLRESVDVRREVNWCWGPMTPYRLIRNLFADPVELAAAANGILTAPEQARLRRERTAPWTRDDVALLDEAAELLGEDDSAPGGDVERAKAEAKMDLEQAKRVLETSGTGGMLTAESIVERYAALGDVDTVAERAADDRQWAYAHVVVDEAQELSSMTWRLLMRRCPTRSMTVVGDVAQTGSAGGVDDWAQALDPYVPGRWRMERLEINYRTPSEIMQIAADVLATAGTGARAPKSARDGTWPPTSERTTAGDELLGAVLAAVRADLVAVDGGRVAVICPRERQGAVADALAAALPAGDVVSGTRVLDAQVSVLTVAEAKGLEFDCVVLVEPSGILADSPRGVNDLYVALTRSTQRLHVVHSGDLPRGLTRLTSQRAD